VVLVLVLVVLLVVVLVVLLDREGPQPGAPAGLMVLEDLEVPQLELALGSALG